MKKIFAVIFALVIFGFEVHALELEYKIEPQYDYATDFYKGLAKVTNDSKTAIIDKDGKVIIDFSTSYKIIRANGLIMHINENDKAGFFNKDGAQVTDYIYDVFVYENPKTPHDKTYHFPFSGEDGDGKSDLIPVSRGGKFGYINSKGEEVIPLELEYAYGFYGKFAKIASESPMGLSIYGTYLGGKFGIIDENGKIIVPANSCWDISRYNLTHRTGYPGETLYFVNSIEDSDFILFPDGTRKTYAAARHAGVRHILRYDENGNPYVVDANPYGKQETIIFPVGMYPEIKLFGDNFIVGGTTIVNAKNERLYDLNDTLKQMGLEYGSLKIYSMDDKFAQIYIPANDGVYGHAYIGLVDHQGNVILPPEYDFIADRGEGIIYARVGNENFLFDYRGNLVTKVNGQLEGNFNGGLALFWDFDTMKRGYIENPLHPKVFIDGKRITSDTDAKIHSNRTLVPMRAIFEALGAEVSWDGENRTATAKKGDDEIRITIGSYHLYKNGEYLFIIDVPAVIENNRTLVPLRVISEALKYRVEWNAEERRVDIFSK